MADQLAVHAQGKAPEGYRQAPGSDRCDSCLHRRDDGLGCTQHAFGVAEGYRPAWICGDFAQRSIRQMYQEEETRRGAQPPAPHTRGSEGQPGAEAGQSAGSAVVSLRGATADASLAQTINGVEIFRVGKWNGKEYTAKDLDEMVKNYGEVGYVPPVTLGHTDNPDAPAYGWVRNLRRDGDVLLADFSDVPDDLVDMIKDKRYDAVSSEIYFDLPRDDKKFRRALRCVAILGAHPPGVSDLKPLSDAVAGFAAFAVSTPYERVTYTSMEQPPMTTVPGQAPAGTGAASTATNTAPPAQAANTVDAAEVERLRQQVADLTAQHRAAATAGIELQRMAETVTEMRQQLAQQAETTRQERIKGLVGDLKLPAYRQHVQALAELCTRANPGQPAQVVRFQAMGTESAVDTDAFAVLQDLVRLINTQGRHLFSEQLKVGDAETARRATFEDDPGAQLYQLAAEYRRKHPSVTSDQAWDAVLADPANRPLVQRYSAPGHAAASAN